MRAVNFDYPNTCPIIDRAISQAETEIRSFLEGLLEEICPFLPNVTVRDLAESNTQTLYSAIEGAFETTRKSNEDMRSEADSQIEDLKVTIADLEHRVRELE